MVVNGEFFLNGGSGILFGDQGHSIKPTNHATIQRSPMKIKILDKVPLKEFAIVFDENTFF